MKQSDFGLTQLYLLPIEAFSIDISKIAHHLWNTLTSTPIVLNQVAKSNKMLYSYQGHFDTYIRNTYIHTYTAINKIVLLNVDAIE